MAQPVPAELHTDTWAAGAPGSEEDEQRKKRLEQQLAKADQAELELGPFYKAEKYSADEIDALGQQGHAFKNPDGHYSYPIKDAEDLGWAIRAVGRGGASHEAIRAYIAGRAKALGASEKIPDGWASPATKAQFETVVALWKDDAKQIVYGVVLTPGVRDSQGDEVTAEDIEKAAHRFLVQYRKHDIQHAEKAAGVETVESFIAPQDLQIAGEKVIKGSWVMATHVSDRAAWERVDKGELTGYSIGGSGVRLADEAS